MSIVPLVRVTLVGMSGDKERLLSDLYDFGCLEIIPPKSTKSATQHRDGEDRSKEALRFLLASPQRRTQSRDAGRFDAFEVESRSLELKAKAETLEAERDEILQCIKRARPFGDFDFFASRADGALAALVLCRS